MRSISLILALGLLTACDATTAQSHAPQTNPTTQATETTQATQTPPTEPVTAEIIGIDGQKIGDLKINAGSGGILLQASLQMGSLTPGWHGLHLHQVGDCSDLGVFKKSGGHVGKIDGGHGLLNPQGPEGGDLPNIWVANDGSAGYEAFSSLTHFSDLTDSDGAALIIHQNRDDHISQPIGGAGPRVACAVIR